MKPICTLITFLLVSAAAISRPINRLEMPFTYDFFLYPEVQYGANPAVAAPLPTGLDTYDGEISYAGGREEEEATGGDAGRFFSAKHEIDLVAGYDRFRVINPGVTLFSFLLDSTYSWQREEDTGLSTPDVTTTERSSDFELLIRGDYLRARSTETGGFGWSTFLVGRWDPTQEEFVRLTETGVNDDGQFFAPGNDSRVLAGFAGGGLGVTDSSGSGWRGLGFVASVGLTDRSGRYRTADTAGAGVSTEIVSEQQFQTNDDWGAGNDFYEHRDWTISARALLTAAVVRPIEEQRGLIVSGFMELVDGSRRASYTHTDPEDESKAIIYTGALGSEGGVFAGFRQETDYGAEWRYGLSLRGGARFRRDNSVDADGESLFTAQNRGHLVESTTTNPDNGDVVSIAGIVNPNLQVEATLSFLSALEWRIGTPIVLFLQGDASVTADYDRYRYFDTTNDLVWSEWTLDHSLRAALDVDFGVQFALPNGTFLTVGGALPRMIGGSAGLSLDPLPNSPEGQSPGVSLPRESSNGQSIGIALEVVVRN